MLEYYNTAVQSARTEHFIPAVMRVRAYVKRETRGGRLALSRRNLAIRDMWTCQYVLTHTVSFLVVGTSGTSSSAEYGHKKPRPAS